MILLNSSISSANINEANSKLDAFFSSGQFKKLVLNALTQEKPTLNVLNDCLKKFRIVLFDKTLGKPIEPDFICLMDYHRFNSTIQSDEDLINQFLHTAMHLECNFLWKQVFVPKNQFSIFEFDLFEEIYGQVLVKKYWPPFFNYFPNGYFKFLEFCGRADDKILLDSVSLFTNTPNASYPLSSQLITWLYQQTNLLDRDIFSKYLAICLELKNTPEILKTIGKRMEL